MRQILVAAFKALPRGEQTRIADELGERVQTVNKWAKGYNSPGPDVDLRRLEELLHLEAGSLGYMAGTTPPSPDVDTAQLMGEILRQGDAIHKLEKRIRALTARVQRLDDQLGLPPAPAPRRSRAAGPTDREGKVRP